MPKHLESQRKNKSILYPGSLSYRKNVTAITYLVEKKKVNIINPSWTENTKMKISLMLIYSTFKCVL